MPNYIEPPERALTVERRDHDHAVGTVAVLTLAAGGDGSRPTTVGDLGLTRLAAAIADIDAAARAGTVDAVVLTGTARSFVAGADLDLIAAADTPEQVLTLGQAGHALVSAIRALTVPSLAHLTGPALGGGYEIALACGYRIAREDVRGIGLPETSLGIIPGWGGCTLLPRLVGPEKALQVILELPAKDRTLDAYDALESGLVDALVPGGDDLGLSAAIDTFAAAIRDGRTSAGPAGGRPDADLSRTTEALGRRRPTVVRASASGNPAPMRAWELVAGAATLSVEASFAAEDEALAELATGDACRASLYAARLLRRARATARTEARGAGATVTDAAATGTSATGTAGPGSAGSGTAGSDGAARSVRSAGIVGAGLMAAQLALLLATHLRVPVTMRDLDTDRVRAGLDAVDTALAKEVEADRTTRGDAAAVRRLISATTDLTELAGSDLVIEAVSERLDIKRAVFAELEDVVGPETVLATNTSALSVTAMAEGLRHPERVVGLHFFNPVARMPLVEVVRTPSTDTATHATGRAVAAAVGKIAVDVQDAPGFVVNRLLLRLLAEVLGAVEDGTPPAVADRALDPMGLPMRPFALLDLVGAGVADHALDALRVGLGDRYPDSPGLRSLVEDGARATTPDGRLVDDLAARFGQDGEDGSALTTTAGSDDDEDADPVLTETGVLDRVVGALGEETRLLLADGVAASEDDVNLALILGAGFPRHRGGLTPFLRSTGELR